MLDLRGAGPAATRLIHLPEFGWGPGPMSCAMVTFEITGDPETAFERVDRASRRYGPAVKGRHLNRQTPLHRPGLTLISGWQQPGLPVGMPPRTTR